MLFELVKTRVVQNGFYQLVQPVEVAGEGELQSGGHGKVANGCLLPVFFNPLKIGLDTPVKNGVFRRA